MGSAVLYAALALLLVHLWKHPEEAFPVDASLAERQAWVAVVFVALIAFDWLHFVMGLRNLGTEADELANSASRPFAFHLGMLIVGWIVLNGVVRSGYREGVALDERDLRIARAASRAGSGVMTALMVGLIVALATISGLLVPWLRPLIVANVLIGLLIANALTESAYLVVRYRRERA